MGAMVAALEGGARGAKRRRRVVCGRVWSVLLRARVRCG
jgi:hypothetical protein